MATQINNRKLARHFAAGYPYCNKPRAVIVENTLDGPIVYARLYKTNIVKRFQGHIWVQTGGWNTITTIKAINACLPHGWAVSRNSLITPNGNTILLKENDWTELAEPEWYAKYVAPLY